MVKRELVFWIINLINLDDFENSKYINKINLIILFNNNNVDNNYLLFNNYVFNFFYVEILF